MRGWRELLEHRLPLVFAALLVPLAAILVLQYRWLTRLERATAVARQAALGNCLHAVGTEVRFFYLSQAERNLNVPPSVFTENRLAAVAATWEKRPVEGARRLFLVDFTQDPYGQYYTYDADQHVLVSPMASDESLAIILACSPWQMLRYRRGTATGATPVADERDPQYRIVLNPITDEWGLVLGVAGMILDEEYLRTKLLPEVLDRTLPAFFPDEGPDATVVTVHDRKRNLVFRTAEDSEPDTVEHDLPFVFTDWTLGMHARGPTPARWARANFFVNMGMGMALALALAGGVLLALRAAGRAMRLSRMQSDFVSNVSHELRTPLASIRVFGELLHTGRIRDDERVREYGERIESESRRLSRLVDNILDFARIESGRKSYRFATVDLRDVVETALRDFEARLAASGFQFQYTAPAQPILAAADREALGGAVTNLLDNAVKYSGTGREVRVELATEGGEAVIRVTDRGIGIERHEQEKIFERFHRVGSSLVHDVRGAGLGLAIVHHVARAHRGRVTVESEPGRGSAFGIRVPLAATEPAAAESATPASPGADRPAPADIVTPHEGLG
jgi:signal transduction histidine kinase